MSAQRLEHRVRQTGSVAMGTPHLDKLHRAVEMGIVSFDHLPWAFSDLVHGKRQAGGEILLVQSCPGIEDGASQLSQTGGVQG